MANLLTADFETGPSGAALTTSNTGADAVFGTPTFAGDALEGSLCARFNAPGVMTKVNFLHSSTATVGWVSFYFKVAALPPANAYMMEWASSGGTAVVDARIATDGKIVVRNGTVAAITSGVSITAGAWHRLAIRVTRNTGMELRLYLGANRHGITPDWSGTGSSTVDQTLGKLSVGVTAAGTVDLFIDRVRVDSATEPASMIPEEPVLPTPVLTVTKTDPTAPAATDGQAAATWTGAGTFESCILPGEVTTGAASTRSSTATNRTFTGLAAGTYTVAVRRTV